MQNFLAIKKKTAQIPGLTGVVDLSKKEDVRFNEQIKHYTLSLNP